MRIAHFIHRYPPAFGGSESYCARLSEYLVKQGHDVEVWTSTARALPSLWQRGEDEFPVGDSTIYGVKVRRFAPTRFPFRRYLFKAWSMLPHARWSAWASPCNPTSLSQWKKLKQTPRVDATHAFAFPYTFPAYCAWKLAKRCSVPFYMTPFLHLGDLTNPKDRTRKQYTRRPMRWLLRQADGIFVQTPPEADALASLGVPRSRIHLQGLGVEPSECTGGNRMRARRQWGVSNDDVIIGHLANLSAEKGTVDLLCALAWFQNHDVSYRIVLAGPIMPNLEHYLNANPHKYTLIHLGPIDDDERRDFYAGIDIFALPSRSDSFGLVLLEAWANELPNVAYQSTALAEVIQQEVNGLLAPFGSLKELSQSLQRLVRSPTERQHMGQAGAARIASGEFEWPTKLRIVEDVIMGHHHMR